jgi:hypothetical protein
VKKPAVLAQHQIVQVSVADPQYVHDHAVARAALHERFHDVWLDPERAVLLGGVQLEVAGQGAVLRKNLQRF